MAFELYNADCIEEMDRLISKGLQVDTIITSPPYNKKGFTKVKKTSGSNHTWGKYSIDYSSYNDDLPEEEYIKWQLLFFEKCFQLLKENGSFFYNHKPIRANNKIVFHPYTLIERQKNFLLYQEIIWNRKNSPNVRNDVLLPTTERIYWLVKGKPVVNKSNLMLNFRSEVWDIAPRVDKTHPATFPYTLASNCILLTTKENDWILDPFMGSGTTGIASKALNRNFIGIELDKNYYEIAKLRMVLEDDLFNCSTDSGDNV